MLLSLARGTANASPNYEYKISRPSGQLTCALTGDHDPSFTDMVAVQFDMADALQLKKVVIHAGAADLNPTPSVDGKGGGTVTFQPNNADSFKATITTDQGSVSCSEDRLKPAAAPPAATEVSDDDAYRWWLSTPGLVARYELKRAGEERGLPAGTAFMIHLPSGRLVYPSRASFREGTTVQIAVISARPAGYDVESKDCAALSEFRATGDAAASPPAKSAAASGIEAPNKPRVMLVGAGEYLRCGAGSASYDLRTGTGAAALTLSTTKLELRPVYSFALVTALGFDTTISHDFEAVASPGMGNVVARKHDRAGPAILVGGQWMIGGVDYTDMQWFNYLANPFIAFDATSPLSGFVVGDTLTLRGGISLGIGLAVHRGTRLKGVQVGDMLGSSGDVPKDDTWREQRLGFYIGVVFDSKVFEALKSM